MAENIHSSAFYTWQPSYGSIGDPNEDLTEDKVDDSQEPEEPQFNPPQDALSSSSSISSQPDITTYSSLDTFIPDVSNNYRTGNIDLLIIIELFILNQNEYHLSICSPYMCLGVFLSLVSGVLFTANNYVINQLSGTSTLTNYVASIKITLGKTIITRLQHKSSAT